MCVCGESFRTKNVYHIYYIVGNKVPTGYTFFFIYSKQVKNSE